MLDEWHQIGGRWIGSEANMARKSGRIEASAWLIGCCGFLEYIIQLVI
jgi:hypothetical protein